MATATRSINVGSYYVTASPWNGTWIYGFSHGTYKYGDIDDFVFILDDYRIVTLNTVRWTSSDPAFLTGQGSIYFRLDGLSSDTGWTSFTINGYTYNRADCTAFPGDGAINWKVSAPVNPFGTSGVVTFALNGVTESSHGLLLLNDNGYPRLTFNDRVNLIYGYYNIAANSTTFQSVQGMTTDGTWQLCLLNNTGGWMDTKPTVTVSNGGFSINWNNTSATLYVMVMRI